jgi:N-acetylmuramoyl-L-alanine amidase
MPAILVEAGFMTNQTEAALLKTDSYRRKVAAAIVAGLAEVYGLKRKQTSSSTVTTKEAVLSSVNVIVNGTKLTGDDAGFIVDGTTYVPARAVAEAFGAGVTWDAATRTVVIIP